MCIDPFHELPPQPDELLAELANALEEATDYVHLHLAGVSGTPFDVTCARMQQLVNVMSSLRLQGTKKPVLLSQQIAAIGESVKSSSRTGYTVSPIAVDKLANEARNMEADYASTLIFISDCLRDALYDDAVLFVERRKNALHQKITAS